MSARYDKSVSMSREEEGSYQRREYELSPLAPRKSYHLEGAGSGRAAAKAPAAAASPRRSQLNTNYSSDEDEAGRFDEWTTSKRKVNHKTRQVETRVSRQLLVEDGKVIADSGPQVTTRIKEDNKVEECEKEKAPKKGKHKFEALEAAREAECGGASGRVLGEKKEIQRVSREVREENMQYHDERFKELTGHDVHRRAIQAPHELITITDEHDKLSREPPRGKMVHYSNKAKKYQDTDEILEVAKLAIDGSVTKEVKRTRHHEEFSDDEKPDEAGEAEALREAPTVTRSSRRHVDYVNDFDDTDTPSEASDDEVEHYDNRARHHAAPRSGSSSKQQKPSMLSKSRHQVSASSRERDHHHRQHQHQHEHQQHQHQESDDAFPRYKIDPLLSSLQSPEREQDVRSRGSRVVQHRLERKQNSDSSSELDEPRTRQLPAQARQRQPTGASSPQRVEIPELYRANKQRLLESKSAGSGLRSKSPEAKSYLSQGSRRSAKAGSGAQRRRDDASVQAHLTDEEQQQQQQQHRQHQELAGGAHGQDHGQLARKLQRESNQRSQRKYFYGPPSQEAAGGGQRRRQRPASASSLSSSSSASSVSSLDPKARGRAAGVRSRDSGFKSPSSVQQKRQQELNYDSQELEPELDRRSKAHNNQIYAVSSKHASARSTGARSPGSARRVKTTTTTLAAGLADRPRSGRRAAEQTAVKSPAPSEPQAKAAHDALSLASLGQPGATTIQVPYSAPGPRPLSPQAGGARPARQRRQPQVSASSPSDLQLLQRRLSSLASPAAPAQFQYETLVADVQRAPPQQHSAANQHGSSSQHQKQQQHQQHQPHQHHQQQLLINKHLAGQQQQVYNVRVIEHNSPFHNYKQPVRSVGELSNSIARLEQLSCELSSSLTNTSGLGSSTDASSSGAGQAKRKSDEPTMQTAADDQTASLENNNESNFELASFVKRHERRGLGPMQNSDQEDHDSLASSACSLKSSRTYDVPGGFQNNRQLEDDHYDHIDHFQVQTLHRHPRDTQTTCKQLTPAHESHQQAKARSTAWIYDPLDNSSTAIVAPPRPRTPQLQSKTEELARAPGGRAYYLELLDLQHTDSSCPKPPTLTGAKPQQSKARPSSTTRLLEPTSRPKPASSVANLAPPNTSSAQRVTAQVTTGNQRQPRQLSTAQPPPQLGDRSKSLSHLAPTTRPSKYSIYGGLRRSNAHNKPVPRLSYSRAIGPKSQRDTVPTTPSRYLKMR